MNSEIRKGLLLIALLTVLGGCTPNRDDADFFSPVAVDLLVIDAVLLVDRPLPPLRLSRSLAPDESYLSSSAGESGATVEIQDADGVVTAYREVAGSPGLYVPDSASPPLVRPETAYDLLVESGRGEILTARTLTPAPIVVDRWLARDPLTGADLRDLRTFDELGDGVYDAPENQLPYASAIVEAQLGTLSPTGYQLSLFSIDPESDYVIEPPFFEDEDFEGLERSGSSPAVTAENGGVNLPWFSVFFEGRYIYKIFSVDRNWFDLRRSIPESGGNFGIGGTLGDGFEVPLFHVNGGIGLFGSGSVDSLGFRVLPAE